MHQIDCRDLSIGYGNHILVKDLNFKVKEGDYLCIVGENGAGKTTLMRTLLGLNAPAAGSICLEGGLRQGEIGYLPQQTEVQKDFPASVSEVVLSGCQNRMGLRPFYGRKEKSRAREAMAAMHIEALADACFRELSGGQKQRVLLARALTAAQKILLLDEPVAGLDPVATREMYEQIRRLNEDGMTVIMITHDVEEALRYADHILCLGREPWYGTKEAFAASAAGRSFLSSAEGGVRNE